MNATVEPFPGRERLAPADHKRLRRRAAQLGLVVVAVLVAAKLAAWLATGSVAVLSSLFDNAVDLAAMLMTLVTLRFALAPPDKSHRFGHGKAEAIGALAQAALLVGSAVVLGVEAVTRFIDPQPMEAAGTGLAVMALSVALTGGAVLYQRRVVALSGSMTIEAASVNFLGDLAQNVAVIAALLISGLGGVTWFDPLAGLAIAIWLVLCAGGIAARATHLLMDRELPPAARARIAAVVRSHPEVVDFHDLRTRDSGTRQFIELHLEVDGAMTVADAHDICDVIEEELMALFPTADILLHQEPAGLDDWRLDREIAQRMKA